jgi:hypothetical protein
MDHGCLCSDNPTKVIPIGSRSEPGRKSSLLPLREVQHFRKAPRAMAAGLPDLPIYGMRSRLVDILNMVVSV